jgi:hypothetical protein
MPLYEVTDTGLRHHEAGTFKPSACMREPTCSAYFATTSLLWRTTCW